MKLLFNISKQKNIKNKGNRNILPRHIGIIMDGNGRWAKKRGLTRKFGHNAGAKNFRTITKYCSKIGIKYLTAFAFSTENWKRPLEEVNALMDLFRQYLEEALSDFKNENIKVKFLGDKKAFSSDLQGLIKKVEESSGGNNGMVLNIAMNYGGRAEIVSAVKAIAAMVSQNKLRVEDISEEKFSEFLYTEGQPEVDLVIRTSGEFRTSNFMIWQAAYAEYFVSDTLWPDFKSSDLDYILELYSRRERRFGGV